MKNRLIIATFCFFAGLGTLQAQHELSFNAFGGYQPINLTFSQNGKTSGNIGFVAGIGYNYNINKQWSIGTGADLSLYSSSVDFAQLNDTHVDYDTFESTSFTFTADITNYKENVSMLLLEIPLTVRYTLPVGKNSIYIMGGGKFGLPLSTNYTASAGNLTTTGGYYDENQVYHDVPEVFGTGKMEDQSGSWVANTSIQLTVEAAYRFAIGAKMGLSVGVFCNYGLNNMQSKNTEFPIAFNVNSNKPYSSNSIINSNLVSAVKPLAIGLKLRFDLGL